jgi:hypothetical protein
MIFLPSVSARYLQENFDGLLVDPKSKVISLVNTIASVEIGLGQISLVSVAHTETSLVVELEYRRTFAHDKLAFKQEEIQITIEKNNNMDQAIKTLSNLGLSIQQPSQNFFSISEESPIVEIVTSPQISENKKVQEFSLNTPPHKEGPSSEQKEDSPSSQSKLGKFSMMSGLWNLMRNRKSTIESSSILQGQKQDSQTLSRFNLKSRPSLSTSTDSIIHRISKQFSVPMNLSWAREKNPIKNKDSLIVKRQELHFVPFGQQLKINPEPSEVVFYITDSGISPFEVIEEKQTSSYDIKTQETVAELIHSPRFMEVDMSEEPQKKKFVGIGNELLTFMEKEIVQKAELIIEKNYSKITCMNIFRDYASKNLEEAVTIRSFKTIEMIRRLMNIIFSIQMDFNVRVLFLKLVNRIADILIGNLEELVVSFFSYRNKDFKSNSYTTLLIKIFVNEIGAVSEEYIDLFLQIYDLNQSKSTKKTTNIFNYSSDESEAFRRELVRINKKHISITEKNAEEMSAEDLITHIRDNKFDALFILRKELHQELEDL